MFEKGLTVAIALGAAIFMLGATPVGVLGESGKASFPSERLSSQVFVKVRGLTHEESQRFNLGGGVGVTIVWIDPEGPLGQVGFEVGDMILEVDGEAVRGLRNFVSLFNCLDHHSLVTLLGVDHRSGRKGYVQIIMP